MTAQPAALTIAEGMTRDIAARNGTVRHLAGIVTGLRRIHPAAGTCPECGQPAPCQTRQILDKQPAT